ncbi:MAG: extracellular solute-binding protein [Bacilli bacterium]|nr:extracellular solute-binding protein [Bacilli bacterium]
MKKLRSKYLLLLPIMMASAALASGCSSSNHIVLRVLNAGDYIYEGGGVSEEELEENYAQFFSDDEMMVQFKKYIKAEYGQDIDFVYDTYDTNETMFNELMTGKSSYDVIVASDYMVQKLISYDLIQSLPSSGKEHDDIKEHVSPYLWNIFDGIFPKDKKTNERLFDKPLSNYSVPYMWGTVGMMYSPEFYETKFNYDLDKTIELFSSWDSLYSRETSKTFSVKDSVRDTYVVGVIHTFEKEISELKTKLENGEIDETQFNKSLNDIFNRCDDETLKLIQDDLIKLRDNSFGFEVDQGKTDMVEGKIGANLAWSGDASWAISEAETDYEKELYFSIPEEGSNIWFDAFCIPTSSKNAELAYRFIDFMSKPESAIQNAWYVGYTSAIASDDVLDLYYSYFDVRGEIGGESEDEYIEYDLSYFFKDSITDPNDAIIHADESQVNRMLTATFPEGSDLPHLCVMDDFGTQNEKVLDMWEHVRSNPLPIWALIILIVEIVVAAGLITFVLVKKRTKNKMIKQRRALRNR